MAMQSIANGMGFLFESGAPNVYTPNGTYSGAVMDAAGESTSCIGKVYIEGAASSKTISGAGGKILFRTTTCTFANAGTNFRIGIQDVASTGLEDGTFDVYADFTGGGGGLASNTWYEKSMVTGSKTISHGDIIAISFEMTSKAGSDSIAISVFAGAALSSNNSLFPYRTADTGAGPARQTSNVATASIVFDDGTLGWIEYAYVYPSIHTSINYQQTSTPDEYAAVFQVPFKCSIKGGYLQIGNIGSVDNFDIILYSDPQGTPVAERTVSVDPDYVGGTGSTHPYFITFNSLELTPGVWYALSCRPTTNNSITILYHNFSSTFGNKYKKPLPFGANCKFSARTNQSGAFTEVQTYHMPIFGLLIDGLDDGAGGGSLPFTTVSFL